MDADVADRSKWLNCYGKLIDFIAGKISSPDCATEKGFSFAEVHVAKDLVVHFYDLHANTGAKEWINRSDLNDASSWINSRSVGFPVVIVGDFNMSWSYQTGLLQEY